MKQTLLSTLSFFTVAIFMTVFTTQIAVADSTFFSSDSCASIDRKIMKLDSFTTMVNNTSAFHLEEKAAALTVPGITVSNNKKKMLRDAEKKYAAYAAERKKYDCETAIAVPAQATDKKLGSDNTDFSSDSCASIDRKIMKLDSFTTMVNNTSAFHLEEKAVALTVPGITVSNNKKKMLRDAEKKYAEYAAERKKYDCKTPMAVPAQATVKKAVARKSANIEKKIVKRDLPVSKVGKRSAVPVTVVKKDVPREVKRQTYVAQTPVVTQRADKKAVVNKPVMSSDTSDECAAINKKIIRLNEFTTMVNNTSAFHLEEKAAALPVPGITVSNNKKKMLRVAKKKGVELLKEYQKYGCARFK